MLAHKLVGTPTPPLSPERQHVEGNQVATGDLDNPATLVVSSTGLKGFKGVSMVVPSKQRELKKPKLEPARNDAPNKDIVANGSSMVGAC